MNEYDLAHRFSTTLYPETHGGLLVCGINWGGDPNNPAAESAKSFFSDAAVSTDRFQRRIVQWFQLLGRPLQKTKGSEGSFERCIAQSNWLRGQSSSAGTQNTVDHFVDHADEFFPLLEQLEPTVILFAGVKMLTALNHATIRMRAEKLLGARITEITWDRRPRCRAGFQSWQQAEIVALPHPRSPVSYESIGSLRGRVLPVLDRLEQRLLSRSK